MKRLIPILALTPATAFAADGEDLKSALLSLFVQHVLPILATGIGLLGAWALAKLAQKLDSDGKGSKVARLGAWAAHLASTVVADLEVTLRPKLKASTADGKLTPEEVKQLRDEALARLKALAGEKGLEELRKALGIAAPELDKYLLGLLEKAVGGLRAPASP